MPRYCSRCSGVCCRRCYSRVICTYPMGSPCTACGPPPCNQNAETKNLQESYNQILTKYYTLCSKVSECINKGYSTYQDMTYEDKEQFCKKVAPLIGSDSKPTNCMKDFLAKRNNACNCSKKNESTSTLEDKCKLQDFLGTSLIENGDGQKNTSCVCTQISRGTLKSQDGPNMKDCSCSKDENDRQFCKDIAPLLKSVKPEKRSQFQSAFDEFKNSPAPAEVDDDEFHRMMMEEYKSLPQEKKILFRGFVSGFLSKTKIAEQKSSSKKNNKYSETDGRCNSIIIETSETVSVNYGQPQKSSIKKEATEEVLEQQMEKSDAAELQQQKKPSENEGAKATDNVPKESQEVPKVTTNNPPKQSQEVPKSGAGTTNNPPPREAPEVPKSEVSFKKPSTNPFDEPEPTPSICTGSVKSLCTGSIRSGAGPVNENIPAPPEPEKNDKSKKDKKKRLFF